MNRMSRRAVLGGLLAGGGLVAIAVAAGDWLRGVLRFTGSSSGMMGGGMMGTATQADISTYTELFGRHAELQRSVEEIAGGVRTTTESDVPELVGQLQAHVSMMYTHLDQRAEVTCMSDSLPTLFAHSSGYRRQLVFTTKGVSVTETSDDPALVSAIRKHAQEVSGFVRDGMPAMMKGMM